MKHYLIAIYIILSLLFTHKIAFGQLEISAEIRPRVELRNGYKTLRAQDDKPAFFIEQRTRLYLNYARDKFNLHMSLQDVRIWGETSQTIKTDSSLSNLYEGYIKYNFAGNWWVKAGRMALQYDNSRFFGDLDWHQQGGSHDALLIQYSKNENLKFHLGAAFNQQIYEPTHLAGTEYLNINNYKTMQYIWLHKQNDLVSYSFLFQNDGRQTQDTTMAYRQTYGFYSKWQVYQSHIGAEIYYQGGKNESDISVSSYLIALSITLPTDITPFTIGLDYLSGTSTNDETDHSFVPLYGTNHDFYGYMDYFYVGNPHSQNSYLSGLVDFYIKTEFNLTENSSLKGHLHYFRSPVKLYNPDDLSEKISKNLGSELDVQYELNIAEDAKLWVGYSQIFATDGLIFVKDGNGDKTLTQNWAWIMFQFKPTLFKSDHSPNKTAP